MNWRGWRLGLPLAAVGCALGACSLLVPLDDEQCSTNGDCTSRGGAFAGATCSNHVCVGPALPPVADAGVDAADAARPDTGPGVVQDSGVEWACLDDPSEVTDPNVHVDITFNVFDALSDIVTAGSQGGSDFTVLSTSPIPGIAVQGCGPLGANCTKPVTPLEVTDDAGQATVTVTSDFNGYFSFTGSNYLANKLYPGQLLPDASTFAPPVAMLGTDELSLLSSAVGVPVELDAGSGVGQVFFQAYDCFDRHGPGVTFAIVGIEAGPETVQWYTKSSLPTTKVNQTDSLGAGGAVNVPAGTVTMTATLATTGRMLGTVNALVTAGQATTVWIRVRTH